MLDDCDFYFDCKSCSGRGVIGGVYRSVVSCASCGGFGFEQKKFEPDELSVNSVQLKLENYFKHESHPSRIL